MDEKNILYPTDQTYYRSLRDMRGYKIYATDGDIGGVSDFLFDDETWKLRHFLVETENREVLLSPLVFAGANWDARIMNVNLTLKQVLNSPDIDTDLPIARRQEKEFYDYYGWPYYWSSLYTVGGGPYPYQAGIIGSSPVISANEPAEQTDNYDAEEIHLRSVNEILGYNVEATDGGIGFVEDFIVHDREFNVEFVVIDTTPWWFGGRVLFPTSHIRDISWPGKMIYLDVTRDKVKVAPDWDNAKPVCASYTDCLNEHYKK